MSEMIEKVARAICKRAVEGANPHMWNSSSTAIPDYVDRQWAEHKDFARVAIAAMRIPTNDMVSAAASSFDDDAQRFYCWRSMIDAALQDAS